VQLVKTGGGPCVPKTDEWDERVAGVSASFQPLENEYDCDAAYAQQYLVRRQTLCSTVILYELQYNETLG
jgi:hypothetical protein